MTPEQIDRVRSSFAIVGAVSDPFVIRFYDHLFALAPSAMPLFPRDMMALRRKVFSTLSSVVDALDMPDQLIALAGDLGRRHVGYGVRPEHYPLAGRALIASLAETLGPEFDPETRAAWAAGYDLLAGAMLDGAAEN